jgi:hypothetical protein
MNQLMAKITITKDNFMSPAEFQVLLEQMESRSSAPDELLGLLRQLVVFEQAYHYWSLSRSNLGW